MKTNGQITKIANGIYAEAKAGLDQFAEVKSGAVKGIEDKSVDEGVEIISDIMGGVEAIIKAPVVDGTSLPAFLSRFTYSDSFDTITITIRSKLKSAVKFSKSVDIAVNEDIVKSISNAYIDSLYELFYLEEAMANVLELNDKIDALCKENEIPFTFGFDVQPYNNSVIIEITNDRVIFNADVTRAHEIAELSILQAGDEYSDFVCKEATEKLINTLKTVQTTTQLIKAKVDIISNITGTSTKKRASKLIRASYHRQAQFLNKVKEGVGYYNEEVEINGETVEVFALVRKDIDGTLSVVLNPFDVKTLFAVDFDVIAAVKEQMQ